MLKPCNEALALLTDVQIAIPKVFKDFPVFLTPNSIGADFCDSIVLMLAKKGRLLSAPSEAKPQSIAALAAVFDNSAQPTWQDIRK